MSVIRTGSTKEFAAGWDKVFGSSKSGRKKAASKKTATKATKKTTKKKAAKKATKKKGKR